MSKRCCVQCHDAFIPRRNPNQRFCNQSACQNERKRQWRKQKRSEDPDYRENQRRAQKKWREKSSNYWRGYREKNPEYIHANRQKQKIRDLLRANAQDKVNASLLAKSDALVANSPIKSGRYILIPDLAKSDALRVNISLIS
jgi:hypothetical protein